MQHQSCPISHSSSRYACPPFNLRPKTPVFAFNIGFYDPDPNEIDPLDPSCLPNDIDTKANAPGEFVFLTQSPAIVLPSFERQRYSRAPNSSTQTPLLSGYTETLSTPGFTPSPALLWTPPSPHMHDFGHSHPLRDKQRFTPDLYRTIYSEDQNNPNTISSTNKFATIRRAEQENTPPARTSPSTIRPHAPRNNTFLESRSSPLLPPLVHPCWEAVPSGQLLDTFDEKMDAEKVTWEEDDDVDAKELSDALKCKNFAETPP